ncbi:uncharacterized protein LOC121856980 [Homarus americanus]|uniref:uncharacterized protein LOC121856980 n=1 Tax=Homarus americanus TaxID=6706 RepID=UPI001C43A338|nr:uncharacterized protein LOC121856980 [Homarus americanus]
MEVNQKCGFEAQDITNSWKNIFPFLHLPDNASVVWQNVNGGHINPRNLVTAHQTAAQMCDAQILHKIVSTVLPSKCDTHKWDVVTECGSVLQGHRVLVAAGGFAALKPLFHHVAPQMVPDLELRTQTISYLCISAEEAQRLKLMPSLIINAPHGNIDGVYVLPPIKYPDGNWYLKLGHGRAYEERKTTLCEVREWYIQQSGLPECVDELVKYFCHLLPGLTVEKVSGDGCLTSHTPTSYPYIDTVTDGFGVALGGNGCAAKACDEVGRLAARLVVLGEWESEVPKECLKIIWKPSQL